MKPEEGCSCCGKCCLNMRPYMITGTRSRNGRIPCQCLLTREQFEVTVSEQDMRLMYDRSFMFRYPKACPFLTQGKEKTFSCLIYDMRPAHCRDFFCIDKKK
ncbi:MAG: hypothetical protein V1862_14120 [Methanobacteriota archaeon]